MSAAEESLAFQLKAVNIPFEREIGFHPTRRWRFDFALDGKVAVEVEGGVWMQKGGHTTGKGYTKDCEKYNEAALLGWRVFRFTPAMVKSGYALQTIERALDCVELPDKCRREGL